MAYPVRPEDVHLSKVVGVYVLAKGVAVLSGVGMVESDSQHSSAFEEHKIMLYMGG